MKCINLEKNLMVKPGTILKFIAWCKIADRFWETRMKGTRIPLSRDP